MLKVFCVFCEFCVHRRISSQAVKASRYISENVTSRLPSSRDGFRACERITLNAKIAKRAKHLFERFFFAVFAAFALT
jgi:hypothetical protein